MNGRRMLSTDPESAAWPKRGADHRAIRTANEEAGRAANDLTPVSHRRTISRRTPHGAKHERFGRVAASSVMQSTDGVFQRGVLAVDRVGNRSLQAERALPFVRRTGLLARARSGRCPSRSPADDCPGRGTPPRFARRRGGGRRNRSARRASRRCARARTTSSNVGTSNAM